jgi:hypothetical protein
LADGVLATTQSSSDNSTKVATTAYADAAGSGSGAVTALNNAVANRLVTVGATTTQLDAESQLSFTEDYRFLYYSTTDNTPPRFELKHAYDDATGSEIRFTLDKGAAGDDNDIIGIISFAGDNDNQENSFFAKIEGVVADASNGAEGGRLKLSVASHDGEMNQGLVIQDGDAEDEVDVIIGNTATSIVTIPGHIDLAGDIDVDGTLEADAITVDSVALNEYIADTVGAMVTGNTESGITVTYQDGDNTLDFSVSGGGSGDITGVTLAGDSGTAEDLTTNVNLTLAGGNGITTSATSTTLTIALDAALTTVTSAYNTSLKLGRDSQNLIDFATTDNKIILRVNNVDEVELVANVLSPVTSDGMALGTGSLMWSDLFLASGSVINFNNGDMTMTHASDSLTIAGGHLTLVGNMTWGSGSTITNIVTAAGSLDFNIRHTVDNQDFQIDYPATGGELKLRTHDGDSTATDRVVYDSSGNAVHSAKITIGLNDTGYDFKCFGATSGKYMVWDESEDRLRVEGNIVNEFSPANDSPGALDGGNNDSGATIYLDLKLSNLHNVILTGSTNVTKIEFVNGIRGQKFLLRITQSSTNIPTVSWADVDSATGGTAAIVRWAGGGTAPTMTATANKTDVYGFICTDDAGTKFDGFVIGQNI